MRFASPSHKLNLNLNTSRVEIALYTLYNLIMKGYGVILSLKAFKFGLSFREGAH
jgi:hypothetical protein